MGATAAHPRTVLLVTLLLLVAGGPFLVTSAPAGPPPGPHAQSVWLEPPAIPPPSPSPSPPPPPPTVPHPGLDLSADVSVEIDGFLTWAALDRATGEIAHSGEEINTTESMIKAWIAADFLRRQEEAGVEPDEQALDEVRRAIRDSDDFAAESLYVQGGTNEVVERMIDICGLTDTEIYPYWWSRTEMTAIDAVRMGDCLVNGNAAGPRWTDWLLLEMRHVRGTPAELDQRAEEGFEGGHWGIVEGLPPELPEQRVAIKNGWTRIGETDSWHVNCLAVTEEWVLAVLMRYPAGFTLEYGAERCASVAAQLFGVPTGRVSL